jgi:hypothetical protein
MMPQDLLPRQFQADCDRFYKRVVMATLTELTISSDVRGGEFLSLNEFLDNCEKQTSNLLAYEARRSFALILAALFERQLRTWARLHFAEGEKEKANTSNFGPLVLKIADQQTLDLSAASVHDTITELHLLANAVRHGHGPAVIQLRKSYPHFWSHLTEAALSECETRHLLSEFIQISDRDFVRYIRALTRFWGLADREAGAIIDGPY